MACVPLISNRPTTESRMSEQPIRESSGAPAVLFATGQQDEAEQLEHQAHEMAGQHLGKTRFLATALAWNRASKFERAGIWKLRKT